MIIVIGSAIAALGQENAVRDLSLLHVARSRTEPGCAAHNVSVDSENPSRFVFVEYWQDMAALKAHFALKVSQDFVRDLGPLLAAKPDMNIFAAEPVSPT
jgi:quinol monooxygenase YgiN